MAEELQTYLLEHFQWLHRHPELALKEYETTNYVKNVLKQTEGVELLNLGLDTGALAKIEGKEPGGVVAIRADIDALPILEESGLSYSSENDVVCMLVDMISTRQHFLEWQNFLEERESI